MPSAASDAYPSGAQCRNSKDEIAPTPDPTNKQGFASASQSPRNLAIVTNIISSNPTSAKIRARIQTAQSLTEKPPGSLYSDEQHPPSVKLIPENAEILPSEKPVLSLSQPAKSEHGQRLLSVPSKPFPAYPFKVFPI